MSSVVVNLKSSTITTPAVSFHAQRESDLQRLNSSTFTRSQQENNHLNSSQQQPQLTLRDVLICLSDRRLCDA